MWGAPVVFLILLIVIIAKLDKVLENQKRDRPMASSG
jgi:hypothetical protein